MSILDDIKDKAKELIGIAEPFATRVTTGYDASKNKVIVAGFPLDAVVTAVVSSDSITRQEVGIDYYYTTYYEVITARTLTVTVLPTAKCLPVLRLLALKQLESKGWFNIAVYENNAIVNVYRGFIMDLPETSMSREADDRTITFGIKPMHSGISVIDESTNTEKEAYSVYGADPSKGSANKSSTINEVTGKVTTPKQPDTYIEGYEPPPKT